MNKHIIEFAQEQVGLWVEMARGRILSLPPPLNMESVFILVVYAISAMLLKIIDYVTWGLWTRFQLLVCKLVLLCILMMYVASLVLLLHP